MKQLTILEPMKSTVLRVPLIPLHDGEQGGAVAYVNASPFLNEPEKVAQLLAGAPGLLAIAEEIAGCGCDLGDSERRIRLYAAIQNAGGSL